MRLPRRTTGVSCRASLAFHGRLELPRTLLYAGYSAPQVSPTRELF